MPEEVIIYQGADAPFKLTITDKNGTAIDLSVATKLGIFVYETPAELLLAKYSKNSGSGWNTMDMTGAATGIIRFILPGSVTKLAKESKIEVELRAEIPDTNFENNKFKLVKSRDYLATINKAIAKDLTLP